MHELVALEAAHASLRLMPPDLLVERVEQLLARRGPGEGGAVVQRAAEAAEVDEALGCAREGHAHAIEEVDDARRRLAHGPDRRLMGEEVTAADRVDEVDLGRVALALGVDRAVDAALRAHRVRAPAGDEREHVHVVAGLGELDDRGQAREPAADDDEAVSGHG